MLCSEVPSGVLPVNRSALLAAHRSSKPPTASPSVSNQAQLWVSPDTQRQVAAAAQAQALLRQGQGPVKPVKQLRLGDSASSGPYEQVSAWEARREHH